MLKVDKIYVLTIIRHLKRHERIQKILEGINFHFFYGLDAPMNFNTCKYVSDIPQSFFDNNNIDFEYVKRWNIGQLGAYLSIREMIKKAYEEGHNNVLIFEDDILPLNVNFTDKISEAISLLPFDWDIIQLGYEYDGSLYKLSYQRSSRTFVNLSNC